MTSLASRKTRLTILSEDTARYRGKLRRVVVEVDKTGYGGMVRLERTRQRYPFSFAGLHDYAVKIAVEKARAERKAKRK